MTFGEKLQTLRKQRNLSQDALAERLLVTRQAISRWERGDAMPDLDNVLRISKAFGVSLDYLMNDDYESDADIPAVQEREAQSRAETQQRRKRQRILSLVLFWVGTGGMLLIILLSTIIPVPIWIQMPYSEGTSLIPADSSVVSEEEDVSAPEPEYYYVSTEAIKSINPLRFLSYYHLESLFAFLCALALTGAVLWLRLRRLERPKGGGRKGKIRARSPQSTNSLNDNNTDRSDLP